MSVTTTIRKQLRDRAVYWSPPSVAADGTLSWSSPEEIAVAYQNAEQRAAGGAAQEQVFLAVATLEQGGYLVPGTLEDIPDGATPLDVAGTCEVTKREQQMIPGRKADWVVKVTAKRYLLEQYPALTVELMRQTTSTDSEGNTITAYEAPVEIQALLSFSDASERVTDRVEDFEVSMAATVARSIDIQKGDAISVMPPNFDHSYEYEIIGTRPGDIMLVQFLEATIARQDISAMIVEESS